MARLQVCAVSVLVLILVSIGSARAPSIDARGVQDTSWTIMVYMADDTTSPLNWQDDLNEMEAAQQAPGTNVIALVDPYGPDNSVLYKVEFDPDILNPNIVSSVVNDSGEVIVGGEVNMAEAATLSAFVEFSAGSYPAEKYVLVLWGHGAGWRGLCPDGTDILNLTELSDALSQATTMMDRPLDIVVVDSCAEACLETMWQIHPYAKLFLASEKDVPFQGLPYVAVMDDLVAQPAQSIEQFASSIANDYVLWSASNTDYSVTMGVYNLSKVGSLMDNLSMLSVVGRKYDPIFNQVLRATFNNSERYEGSFAVDLKNFAWQLQRAALPLEIKYYALQCMVSVDDVVEHFQKYDNPNPINGVHVQNASGFTIFAPSGESSDAAYANISLAATPWFEFGKLLRNNTETIVSGPGPSVTYESLEIAYDTAVMTWPVGTQSSTVWVFRNQTDGLSLVSTIDSSDRVVRLTDFPGRLTLSTSSNLNGSLSSYEIINLTLHGTAIVDVTVISDGQTVEDVDDAYEVVLVTADGDKIVPSSQPPTVYSHNFRINIPDEAAIGDVAIVQVLEKSTGEVIGARNFFIPSEHASIEVEVVESCGCSNQAIVPLVFSILPGLLILAFAISLYFEKRKRERGPERTD